jgi:hypothetical protein
MYDSQIETKLELAAYDIAPTQALVDCYAAEIAARCADLRSDLALYLSKLADLKQLDPKDITGLGKLYRVHIEHLRDLMCEFALAA